MMNHQARTRPYQGLWTWANGAGLGLALVTALPVLAVWLSLLSPDHQVWAHLADTLLIRYVLNSLALTLGVGLFALVLGTAAAWAVTMADFPGRRFLDLALILPLALPAYLAAYAYTDAFQFAGPLQTALRALTGWTHGGYWFPDLRSLPGAIFVIGIVLYPYVYVLARTAFAEQSACALEVARTLGAGPARRFFQVALPAARPALAGGTALVMMETLADFGAVQHLGVDTFTVGIYRTWFAFGAPLAAMQLAAALTFLVLAVLGLERLGRAGRGYGASTFRVRPLVPVPVPGLKGFGLAALLALLPILGFLVPVAILLGLATAAGGLVLSADFLGLGLTTFGLAAVAAFLAVVVAAWLTWARRRADGPALTLAARIAGLGYALPGSVVAAGVMLPLTGLDHALDGLARDLFGVSTGLIFSGGLLMLFYAYLVRFGAVALQSVESGFLRIRAGFDQVAATLGHGPLSVLTRIHLPLAATSLAAAGALVFVDVAKELPASLILRPFGLETLAIRVYRYAGDERLAEAAPAALAIILLGLIPVLFLGAALGRARRGAGS